MNARYGYVMLLLAAGMWSGCSEEKKDASEKEGVETVLPARVAEVSVMTLKVCRFAVPYDNRADSAHLCEKR